MAEFDAKNVTEQTHHPREERMSPKSGVYFYMIVGFSLVLPVLIICSVLYEQKVVTGILVVAVAALLGWLLWAYWRANRQLDSFYDALSHLDTTQSDHEISVMGGLVSLRIEQDVKQPPVPVKDMDRKEGQGGNGKFDS